MWAARNWGAYFALEEEKLVKYQLREKMKRSFSFMILVVERRHKKRFDSV